MQAQSDFLTLAAARYSLRKFDGRPVAQADLDQILKAGWLAPTAKNQQPQRILVIRSEEALAKLKKCTVCDFGTKTALLICHSKSACWTRGYDGKKSGDIDAAIVTTHMTLAAADLGLGSTWVMHFNPEAVLEEFQLPEDLEPTAFLMLGYPAADAAPYPAHSEYRPLEELVSYDAF